MDRRRKRAIKKFIKRHSSEKSCWSERKEQCLPLWEKVVWGAMFQGEFAAVPGFWIFKKAVSFSDY